MLGCIIQEWQEVAVVYVRDSGVKISNDSIIVCVEIDERIILQTNYFSRLYTRDNFFVIAHGCDRAN